MGFQAKPVGLGVMT